MKGVVLAPILAAVLAVLVTGSSTAAGIAFLVVCVLAVLAMAGQFQRR